MTDSGGDSASRYEQFRPFRAELEAIIADGDPDDWAAELILAELEDRDVEPWAVTRLREGDDQLGRVTLPDVSTPRERFQKATARVFRTVQDRAAGEENPDVLDE